MEIRQKALLPSLREKKRYVAFEVYSENNFSFAQLKEEIINSYRQLFGELGLARTGIDFVEFKNKRGILRVGNKYVDHIKASFCFVRKINKQDAIVRSLGVSGILNKARSKFVSGGEL